PAAVAVHEWLRVGTDDARKPHRRLPAVEIPLDAIARRQREVRGPDARLDAVDVEEPVHLRGPVAREPVDRMDEAAAVARLHPVGRLEEAHDGVALVDVHEAGGLEVLAPEVAGHVELRAARA